MDDIAIIGAHPKLVIKKPRTIQRGLRHGGRTSTSRDMIVSPLVGQMRVEGWH
ncbi:Uncharacterised protein [Mycobacteroides abscessus subsp. abscessus]|nr:Uncharacterised protein [Mycobacteroides abscessus subsp. abscessus]